MCHLTYVLNAGSYMYIDTEIPIIKLTHTHTRSKKAAHKHIFMSAYPYNT